MDDQTVLAIINAINTTYATIQTYHLQDGEHFDKTTATTRSKRPCGYFTVNAEETITETRTVQVPDPDKFNDNFPSLGAAPKNSKRAPQSTSGGMIDRVEQYQRRVAITDLRRTDLNKLLQKTHQNQLIKKFFASYLTTGLTWRVERNENGQMAAMVRGRIPDPYGGMSDAGGGPYKPTEWMVVVVGGGGGNYQLITAYPE